jgi:YVTN family beta-propeller protein
MKRLSWLIPALFLSMLPLSVCPLWAATYAYIPSFDNDRVVRIATSDGTFASVNLEGGPYGAAVMPDGSFVLVTCESNNTLAALTNAHFEDAGTPVPLTTTVGEAPRGVAIAPDGRSAYVANFGDDTVSVITIASRTVASTVTVGDGPWGVAAIHDAAADVIKVYVSNQLAGTVSVITDDGTPEVTQTITGLRQPIGLAATPDGRFVYVANFNGGLIGSVRVIRTSDDTLLADNIPVGHGPWGIAVGSQGEFVYVSNSGNLSRTVTIVRASNHSVYGTISVGDVPQGVAATKNGDFAYVVNQRSNTINEIDVATTPIGNFVIDQDPEHPIAGAFALGTFIGGTPPGAPSGLSATVDGNRIVLRWTDNSTDELGFVIERRTPDGAWGDLFEVAADITEYTDSNLARGVYEYRIRAFNEATDSATVTTSGEVSSKGGNFSWCFIGTLLN